MWKQNKIIYSNIKCFIKTQYLLTKLVLLQYFFLSLYDSCVCNLLHKLCVRKQLLIFFYLFNQNRLWKIILMKFFLSKSIHFFLLLCMIFMFFVHIFLIWSRAWIVQISCFISCHQLNWQSMSLLHFQQSWVMTVTLVCWLNCSLRIIIN